MLTKSEALDSKTKAAVLRLLETDESATVDTVCKYARPRVVSTLCEQYHLQKAERECLTEAVATGAFSGRQAEIFRITTAYLDAYKRLLPWVDLEKTNYVAKQAEGLKRVVHEQADIGVVLMDMICEGNLCYFADAVMEFIDRKQMWTMIKEILFEEDYFIQFDNDSPVILDCGVNIGLAIYYAKHRYPDARITGFEPWNVAYECASRNVQRNGWQNVTLHHAALAAAAGESELTIIDENNLANTLTNRMDSVIETQSLHTQTEKVQLLPLSSFLSIRVDFLKMDIEGMEGQVLGECGERLRNVRWIFVEHHYAPDLTNNDLVPIIELLHTCGFLTEISHSQSFAKAAARRPFSHVGKNVSLLIWGKNSAEHT